MHTVVSDSSREIGSDENGSIKLLAANQYFNTHLQYYSRIIFFRDAVLKKIDLILSEMIPDIFQKHPLPR